MSTRTIRFTLNGKSVAADVMPHETLVDLLQQRFDLRGARESCGQGLCGCCTVILDGQAVSGCLSLAWFLDGRTVETIESLETAAGLDPVQQAFIEAGAFQCGFCTPGFILMVRQLLDANAQPERRGHPALSRRQPVPLLGLSGNPRCRAHCGEAPRGSGGSS